MLINLLNDTELKMLDAYRHNFAYSENSDCSGDNENDIKYILREWEDQKQNLYKLFGNQLVLTKKINYQKSETELDREIDDRLFYQWSSFGRNERNGYQFVNSYQDFMDNNFPYKYVWEVNTNEEKEKVRENNNIRQKMSDLLNSETLRENIYDGPTFTIEVGGKTAKVAHGAKVIRALSKIASAFNLDGFEDFRICHSQILNQKHLEGTLNLSIHPLDYWTMSDNDCDWDSCMSWKNGGCYRQGTVEMMNSPCVVVAYLSAKDDMNLVDDFTWSNKKWRQLFVVDQTAIVGIKAYPYQNKDLSKMIIEWLRDLAKDNLGWTYENDEPIYWQYKHLLHGRKENLDSKSFELSFETGYMYNDFGCTDGHWLFFNADNYILPDSMCYNWASIYYSGKSECMICGQLGIDAYDDEGRLTCDDCESRCRCELCGDVISGDDYYVIDGQILCPYCYDEQVGASAISGEEHLYDNMTGIFVVPRLPKEANKENEILLPYSPSAYVEEVFSDSPEDEFTSMYLKDGCVVHSAGWRFYVYYDELNDEGLMNCGVKYYGNNDNYYRAMEGSCGSHYLSFTPIS